MTEPKNSRRRRLLAVVASLAILAAACAGGGGSETAGGPTADQSTAAIAAAATNTPQLQLLGDLATTQLLDTSDGSITSLNEVVTGDRPVLLWYWAPH